MAKKKEIIDNMVNEVMEGFDFERVHKVMVALDWKWSIGDGEYTVPSVYRIMREADRLLRKVASECFNDTNLHYCGCGGLCAYYDANEDERCLELKFEAETSYTEMKK